MRPKAAGLWISLVLALAPAVTLWLQDAQAQGVLTATFVGAAAVVLNAAIKMLQIYRETSNDFTARSIGGASEDESKLSRLFNG